MFAVLSLCVVLAAQAFAATPGCDMKDRFPGTCPHNRCCAMTGFPNIGISCQPFPKAGEKCTTKDSPFTCPCVADLTCKATVRPDGTKSLYGKCS